jgi:rubrerythrin
MDFESFEDLINFAIEKEREAASFYEDAGRQESYPGAKEAFEAFAREERKHQSMLIGFLKGELEISDYAFKWIPDMKRSDYLVDIEYQKGMHYEDMLRLAMKREEKALKLYNELAKKTEKEDLIALFKVLSQEEAKHKLALETLYDDYMATQGD